MRIELPMGYTFIAPDNEEEPYIINKHDEVMASIMLTGTAVAKAVYFAMKEQVKQAEMNRAVLEGELELVTNLAKLSGVTDKKLR